MRIRKVFVDFFKVFFSFKPRNVKNYIYRANNFIRSRNQLTEQKFILKKINKYKKKIILDYGSNDCYFSTHLNRKYKYYGVDNNKSLQKKNTKIYSKNFICLKSKKIPFKKNFFDCIILSHVIAHIYKPKKLINKLRMHLKKNGIIIIVSPNKYFKFFYFFINIFNNYLPDETISKHYSIKELENMNNLSWKILESYSYTIKNNKIYNNILNSRFVLILKK